MLRNIIFTVVLVLIGGFLYFSYQQPDKLPKPLQSYAPQVKSTIDSGTKQITALWENNGKTPPAVMGITSEASKIFQEDTSEKPIHQKAMDFAQYQYCVQVVKNYETANKDLSSPSATPDVNEEE